MPYPSIFRKAFPTRRKSNAPSGGLDHCAIQSMSAETKVKLRLLLSDDFDTADSWQDLSNRLLEKGFYLRHLDDEILVHDCISHLRICSSEFIGFPQNALESRFDQVPERAAL